MPRPRPLVVEENELADKKMNFLVVGLSEYALEGRLKKRHGIE
jgi:hypothetical protein